MVQLTRPVPTYRGSNIISKQESSRRMAKWEIHKRFGVIQAVWWRFMPGTMITVKWPVGSFVDHEPDCSITLVTSADPNDHYRPELERLCGRQGWDWDWKLAPGPGWDGLVIKLRSKHSYLASYFAVKWA